MAKKTAPDVDQRVLDLIETVKQKKAVIQKAEKPSWKTNCSFGYNPDGSFRVNLQATMDVSILISILGFLIRSKASFDQAAQELNQDVSFSWQGFSFDEWKSDIETRVIKLSIKKEKDNLEKLENRLNGLISPELRRELELAELEKELKQ